MLPLIFAHFIGSECYDNWPLVFKEWAELPGFDVPDRTIIFDQEKSIDKAYKDVFKHAKMFLDPLHVRGNIGCKLAANRAVGLSLYDRALHAPSKIAVDEIVAHYSDAQRV